MERDAQRLKDNVMTWVNFLVDYYEEEIKYLQEECSCFQEKLKASEEKNEKLKSKLREHFGPFAA